MLSSIVMLAVGCLVNNIQRQYPVYWWTSVDLRKLGKGGRGNDLEKVVTGGSREVLSGMSVAGKGSLEGDVVADQHQVVIRSNYLLLPESFDLDADEMAVLARLQARLRWDSAADDERPASLGGRTATERWEGGEQ